MSDEISYLAVLIHRIACDSEGYQAWEDFLGYEPDVSTTDELESLLLDAASEKTWTEIESWAELYMMPPVAYFWG